MKFYIKTFGCQMNVHDSRRIEEILVAAGHHPTDDPGQAELALVNSCSIREKPWHKAISETGRLRKTKQRPGGRQLLVGLVGCVAQQEGDNVYNLLEDVDFVVSPDNYKTLPEVVSALGRSSSPVTVTGFDKGASADFLTIDRVKDGEVSAFVTIMKGCQEHCGYCIVPSVRGPERHRNADEIVNEVSSLVAQGVREVTLLGQKVNAYNHGGVGFAQLLRRVAAVEGLTRLRFTSPHPRHMTPDVIALFGELAPLCGAIHLPLQSGSDTTLKKMRRRYTVADYLDVVDRLRAVCPDIVITTDVIVGFPGETEADFQQTLDLLEKAEISSAFSFKFSPRPGTAAAKLTDDVSDEEKSARLARVHELINVREQQFRNSLLGKTLDVLVVGTGRNPGQLSGRSDHFQIVNFVSTSPIDQMRGQLCQVKITRVHPNSLEGEPV